VVRQGWVESQMPRLDWKHCQCGVVVCLGCRGELVTSGPTVLAGGRGQLAASKPTALEEPEPESWFLGWAVCLVLAVVVLQGHPATALLHRTHHHNHDGPAAVAAHAAAASMMEASCCLG
jgi:hypothetical protein